jgi:16S rRNA processing protein RimM
MANDPAHLVVGHLSKPHGTRGELVVWPLTDRPDEVFAPGRRLLLGTDTGEAGHPPTEVVVEASRPHKRGVLIRLEGVADRNAAEALVTRYLLIPAEETEALEEGEFYYHQLLGLTVETAEGVVVGRVREVYETDPTHLLEVKGEGAGAVHLIPLSRRIVTRVDVEAGRLVIEPPEGLLEL